MPLYILDEKLCARWPVLFDGWRTTFPGLDVLAEIKKAHQWEMEQEPRDRKKQRARFLGRWLRTAQGRLDLKMPGPPRAVVSPPSEHELLVRELRQHDEHRVTFRGKLMIVTIPGLLYEGGQGVLSWNLVRDWELRGLLKAVKGA